KFAVVEVLKRDAKADFGRRDFKEALQKYNRALAFLAEARMSALELPTDDFERVRAEAEASCGPGEPWYFRVLWGAMAQAALTCDDEASKLFANVSLCHGRLGAWSQAQGAAAAAVELNRAWTKAQYRLAEAQSHLGLHKVALSQARRARLCSDPEEVQEVSRLQARVLARSLRDRGVGLDSFDKFDVEQTKDERELEEYKALAMLELDVFRSLPSYRPGIERLTFPDLHAAGDRAWDVDRPQPVRFDDYVRHVVETEGGEKLRDSGDWHAWASAMGSQVRAGLDNLLALHMCDRGDD
ncbi:unnamed protein product, partial [Prorocentrum cordatum]